MGARNSKVKKGDKEGEKGATESAQDTTRQYGTLPASAKVSGKQTDEEIMTPDGGSISKSGTLPANLNRSTSFTKKFKTSAKSWAKDKGILKEKPEPTDDVTETDTGVPSHETTPVKETKQNGIEKHNIEEEEKGEVKNTEDPSYSTAKLATKKARAKFFEDMYNTPEKPKRLDINSMGNNSIVTSTPITEQPASKVKSLIKQVEENESRNSSLSYDVNIKTPTPDIKKSFEFEQETSSTSNLDSTNISIITGNKTDIITKETISQINSQVISNIESGTTTTATESRQETELATSLTTQEEMSMRKSKIEKNVSEITSHTKTEETSELLSVKAEKVETSSTNIIQSEKVSEKCETSELSEKNVMEMLDKGEESLTVCQSSSFSQEEAVRHEEITESVKNESLQINHDNTGHGEIKHTESKHEASIKSVESAITEMVQSSSGEGEIRYSEMKHEENSQCMKSEVTEKILNDSGEDQIRYQESKHEEVSEIINKESSEILQIISGHEEIVHEESSDVKEIVQSSSQEVKQNEVLEEKEESSLIANCMADESNLNEEVDDESIEAANTVEAADTGKSCGYTDEMGDNDSNENDDKAIIVNDKEIINSETEGKRDSNDLINETIDDGTCKTEVEDNIKDNNSSNLETHEVIMAKVEKESEKVSDILSEVPTDNA